MADDRIEEDKARANPGARTSTDDDRHQAQLEERWRRQRGLLQGIFNPCEGGKYDLERE